MPITDKHEYDEIHIPWGVATSVFRYHILNKMLARGMCKTVNEGIAFLNAHAKLYSPVLDGLFEELIAESPYGGIPCSLGRNPSLHRSSLQAVRITKIRKDPDIPTIGISILVVRGLNAVFDGDEINCMLFLDNLVTDEMKHLAPHKSVFDLNEPRQVSGNLAMPKPVVATVSNWLHSLEQTDPVKLVRMEELYM